MNSATLLMFNKIIIRLPSGDGKNSWIAVNTPNRIAENKSVNDTILSSFHNRIIAQMVNIKDAIPDITINTIGAEKFPCKSSAEDKTPKIYVAIP